jgi:hypothetical protein
MNDEQLRAMIRQAVARHLGAAAGAPGPAPFSPQTSSLEARAPGLHPSHYQYLTLVNVGEACIIEPSVTCNHCGYCKSHGH